MHVVLPFSTYILELIALGLVGHNRHFNCTSLGVNLNLRENAALNT